MYRPVRLSAWLGSRPVFVHARFLAIATLAMELKTGVNRFRLGALLQTAAEHVALGAPLAQFLALFSACCLSGLLTQATGVAWQTASFNLPSLSLPCFEVVCNPQFPPNCAPVFTTRAVGSGACLTARVTEGTSPGVAGRIRGCLGGAIVTVEKQRVSQSRLGHTTAVPHRRGCIVWRSNNGAMQTRLHYGSHRITRWWSCV